MRYTVKEYKRELDKRVKQLDKAKIIGLCASTAHANMVRRIFEAGLNKDLAPHGTYSRKPTYVSTQFNSPVKLQGVGKTGESVFKNGNPHKSTYFKGGYRQFKQAINRGGRVNFFLFGQLRNDYATSLQRQGETYVSGIKNSANTDKYRNLVKKFGADSWMFDKKTRGDYTKCIKIKLDKQLLNVPENN